MLKYAGIGARATPKDILDHMRVMANALAAADWTLRSGAAQGADTAFEDGCDMAQGKKEIFLPWDGFNHRYADTHHGVYALPMTKDVTLISSTFHPYWDRLTRPVQTIMGRNAYQVLGPYLDDPVDVVICWTERGEITGGTGQALRIAQHYNIPIVNFASMTLEEIENMVQRLDEIARMP